MHISRFEINHFRNNTRSLFFFLVRICNIEHLGNHRSCIIWGHNPTRRYLYYNGYVCSATTRSQQNYFSNACFPTTSAAGQQDGKKSENFFTQKRKEKREKWRIGGNINKSVLKFFLHSDFFHNFFFFRVRFGCLIWLFELFVYGLYNWKIELE